MTVSTFHIVDAFKRRHTHHLVLLYPFEVQCAYGDTFSPCQSTVSLNHRPLEALPLLPDERPPISSHITEPRCGIGPELLVRAYAGASLCAVVAVVHKLQF